MTRSVMLGLVSATVPNPALKKTRKQKLFKVWGEKLYIILFVCVVKKIFKVWVENLYILFFFLRIVLGISLTTLHILCRQILKCPNITSLTTYLEQWTEYTTANAPVVYSVHVTTLAVGKVRIWITRNPVQVLEKSGKLQGGKK